MRAVSLTTIDKYRKNALHDKYITEEVLKIRLNCLIDATSQKHIFTRGNNTVYQFGSCLLYVSNNIITDIRWTGEKETPTISEAKKMREFFLKNGLNKRGNRFM